MKLEQRSRLQESAPVWCLKWRAAIFCFRLNDLEAATGSSVSGQAQKRNCNHNSASPNLKPKYRARKRGGASNPGSCDAFVGIGSGLRLDALCNTRCRTASPKEPTRRPTSPEKGGAMGVHEMRGFLDVFGGGCLVGTSELAVSQPTCLRLGSNRDTSHHHFTEASVDSKPRELTDPGFFTFSFSEFRRSATAANASP